MIQKILQLVDSLSHRLRGLLIPGGFLAGFLNHQDHQEYVAGGRVVGLGWGLPVMKNRVVVSNIFIFTPTWGNDSF